MGRQTIYTNQRGDTRLHTSGFSWLAAFLWPIWSLQHRLYKTTLLWLIASIPLTTFRITTKPTVLNLAWTLLLIGLQGFGASHLQRYVLKRAGYRIYAREPEPRSSATGTKRQP